MPCAVQPGGISGKRRARYTARRRVALLASARRIQEEEGLSLRAAADRLGVSHSLFVRWQQLGKNWIMSLFKGLVIPRVLKLKA